MTVSLTTGGYTMDGISQDAADMSWTLGDCESNQVYSHMLNKHVRNSILYT